ncbi:Maf family protein [Mycobacterium gordonae]|jgi:septum formation protein|uniref:Nucleoside triphosphate pyrophosphatase n=1 Tax=Mycobacterium gordonae TaxID=1778 RepID=A0A1X1XBB3_MYCGO|nr:nucleoside triphosphate pyrophosphatase [Mycobacterium gordonae]MBI2700220.1 septum formation inhibitor Maf [Mycobacterium sp.]MCV7009919.1 septum formation inhibitor Maf [Mycobacterium gordonae]ODR22048.1 septum formation inhibitor Maf [Mycobacterium gordonae]ORV96122.1 septum formation inhibitor Maf [Mycobacterium gordonae]
MTRLVLGSASSGRLKVLRQAGVEPLVRVSGLDEDGLIAAMGPDAAPDEVVRTLARAKAEHVAGMLGDQHVTADCVVLGCDSMLYLNGQLCGKPASTDDARRQWRSMAGRAGQLHTGHCLIQLRDHDVVRVEAQTSITTVHFGTPSDSDLEAYLASGEPLRVAGAFTLDGLGGWFIDGVDGDPSTVIGVSLPLLRSLLARCGLSVTDLWAGNVA